MSIYYREKAEYFDRAMYSVWDEQTLKPDEIVLVKDGPLSKELDDIIEKWKNKLGKTFKVIDLKENIGLGDALNIGLEKCSYDVVARMDTDDISRPHRFEKQIEFMKRHPKIDIIGSWISEFDEDENKIISIRKLPIEHEHIKNFSKKRCPVNHPSVVFRKEAVLEAGGYKKLIGLEDYYLWARMLENGAKFLNIPECLVHMRTGVDLIDRRRGIHYALREVRLQNTLYKIGHINEWEYLQNIAIRFTTRIMPKKFVKFIYKKIRNNTHF